MPGVFYVRWRTDIPAPLSYPVYTRSIIKHSMELLYFASTSLASATAYLLQDERKNGNAVPALSVV